MDRRQLLAAGMLGTLGGKLDRALAWQGSEPLEPGAPLRDLFPRLSQEVFLNAAGGTPLAAFAEEGARRYLEVWRSGPDEGRGSALGRALEDARGGFARRIGALPEEIAFVQSTKAGEQIVLDGLPALARGGNVVTNDMHFSGSLHNLMGLRAAGMDVRVVRSRDGRVDPDEMKAAIDDRTALVTVSLVSNLNGRIEPIEGLSRVAHDHGALVFADIIQAVGILPLDVRELGVDFAAASGYKWLFGPHGAGFFYARREHQGKVLRDRLFPGHVPLDFAPWGDPQGSGGELGYEAPVDARRYQPGHVNYWGLCAIEQSLRFLDRLGLERVHRHTCSLVARLRDALDRERYPCLSHDSDRSPIIAFAHRDRSGLEAALRSAGLTVSLSSRFFRVSPALYNTEEDVDRLVAALHSI